MLDLTVHSSIRTAWRSWRILFGAVGVLLCAGVATFTGFQDFVSLPERTKYDYGWALVFVALLVATFALCWIWRGRVLIGLTLGALALFVLVTVIRANLGLAFLMLAWFVFVSAALGDKLFDLFLPSLRIEFLERLLLAVSIGFGMLATLVLGLGILQLLYPVVAYGVLILLSVLLLPGFIRSMCLRSSEFRAHAREKWHGADLRLHAIVLGSLAVCLFGGLLWAIAPSVHYDALLYHLSVPAIYVQQHGIVPVPEDYRSYWVHYAEMLYTLGLLLVGQPLPALIHLTAGLLTTGLIFTLGRRIAGTRVGLVGALLFYSVPVVTWQSGTAYDDLDVILYAFGFAYCIVVWWQERDNGWLLVGGTLAGFAFGTKLNAVLLLLPACLLLAGGLVFRYRLSRRCLLAFLLFGTPAVLFGSVWLIRDWVWTGNPVFPLFNTIFKSPNWASATGTYSPFKALGRPDWLLRFISLPWNLAVDAGAYSEAIPAAGAGILSLAALPWLYFWSVENRRYSAILFFLAISALGMWYAYGTYLRYLLPAFPILALLGALNINQLWTSLSGLRWKKSIAPLALSIALAYLGATRLAYTSWSSPIQELFPYRLALGLETPSQFLSRALWVYDALQYLDENASEPKVLSVGNEFRLYTTARIYNIFGSRQAQSFAAVAAPGANLAEELMRQGFDYILVDQNQIYNHTAMYTLPVTDHAFLEQFARLEFTAHQVYVYRLQADNNPAASAKEENLLVNSDFERTDSNGSPVNWIIYGTPLFDGTGTHSHSGRVAVQANDQSGLYERIFIQPDHRYTLSDWSRADYPNQLARLQINWLDDTLQLVGVSIDPIPVDGTWTRYTMTATSPKNATFAQVFASVHGDSQVWFDDYELVQSETPSTP